MRATCVPEFLPKTEHPNPLVLRHQLFDDRRGFVGRAIVDNQDFDVFFLEGLIARGRNGAVKIVGPVEKRGIKIETGEGMRVIAHEIRGERKKKPMKENEKKNKEWRCWRQWKNVGSGEASK
jgi:hypothetical protein